MAEGEGEHDAALLAALRGGVVPGPPKMPQDADALRAMGSASSVPAPTPPPPTPPPAALVESGEIEVMPSAMPVFDEREATLARMATVEALAEQNQWDKIKTFLAPAYAKGDLAASLSLVFAIALREAEPRDAKSDDTVDAEKIARVALGSMLGVGPGAQVVGIAAKRLLRRHWARTPAPSNRTSFLIVVGAVLLGALVGFLIGPARDHF